MHTSEIRRHCLRCGHHKLVKVPRYQDMKEDYCEVAGIPCARVTDCHPDMRVPKGHRYLEYLRSARGRPVL